MRKLAYIVTALICVVFVFLFTSCGIGDDDDSYSHPVVTGCNTFEYKGRTVTEKAISFSGMIPISYDLQTPDFPGTCFHVERSPSDGCLESVDVVPCSE